MPTIHTSLLSIAYRDDGPRDAPVILLLHGWPGVFRLRGLPASWRRQSELLARA